MSKLLKDFVFAVWDVPEEEGTSFIITDKKLWETDHCMDDLSLADNIVEQLGFVAVMESTYEYIGELDDPVSLLLENGAEDITEEFKTIFPPE